MNILNLRVLQVMTVLALGVALGCTTLPDVHHKDYHFPKGYVFIGDVKRPYETLGQVRAKASFESLDPVRDEVDLCRNYYNKAVKDLHRMAQDQGGDAVIDVKSIVFLADGRTEKHTTPECSDDGMEGQVLVQGIAVRWKPDLAQDQNPLIKK